ncbi:MAG: molybdopterin biosynthesis protein [Defluviitaleaceae bacterium]|nr:molybdopterin biosynthesis protein [Defluviitaleaceae bacterium]
MAKRNLYLTNIPIEEGLGRFRAHFDLETGFTELIDTENSLGRVTAQAIFAKNNSPLYNSSAMDGIAVITAKTQGASENSPVVLRLNEDYIPIDTGEPIKPPFDAVIMAEEVQDGENSTAIIRQAAAPWQHIRPIGEDIVQGEMILPSFHKIRPFDIGVLLSGGITQILVKKPKAVAVIPTGSELVTAGTPLKEGDIIESNSHMLAALVTGDEGSATRFPIVKDDYNAIKATLLDAVKNHDIILLCSGTSAGVEDYSIHVLREIGEVIVHGVAMKPGKPVILALVEGKPVIGIPGYPVSAYIAYENFVKPILKGTAPKENTVKATLTRRLVSSFKHREYVRVKIGRIGEKLVATPLARGAGAAMSLTRADGFCIIEQNCEGIEAGTQVNVVLIREPQDLEQSIVSIGSHDMMLDIIADMLPTLAGGTTLSSSHVGSMGGLIALKNGEAHLAPIHQLDEGTGEYNSPIVKKLFKDRQMALIKGAKRAQGLIVKKGNPLNIQNLQDLTNSDCRYINRQRGAGTRMLLDYKLKLAGIDPDAINGYEREAATHMAVAASVAGGGADCGMGIEAAAKAMKLDFIPIDKEEYDFALPKEFLELAHIRAFIDILKNPALHEKLAALGGYDTARIGEVDFLED